MNLKLSAGRLRVNGFPAVPGMSWGVTHGGWLHLSGMVAFDNGILVGESDPETQARQIFRNIGVHLKEVEAGWESVTRLVCYAVNRESWRQYMKIKEEYFSDVAPACTSVFVSGLVDDRFLLEVDATAWVGDESGEL